MIILNPLSLIEMLFSLNGVFKSTVPALRIITHMSCSHAIIKICVTVIRDMH